MCGEKLIQHLLDPRNLAQQMPKQFIPFEMSRALCRFSGLSGLPEFEQGTGPINNQTCSFEEDLPY